MCSQNTPRFCSNTPPKNGVFEMWQKGYLRYWYLSTEWKLMKKYHLNGIGDCCNLIFCVIFIFQKLLFQSSGFSESRFYTTSCLSFCENLDRLASQPIQIFSPVQICFFLLFQVFYVFPCRVNTLGNNCMMTKVSLLCSHWQDGKIPGMTTSPTAIASAELMTSTPFH